MASWTKAGVRTWTQAQALTQSAPSSTDPRDTGIVLTEPCSLEVFALADLTRTLSGAGSLQAYRYIPGTGVWLRAPGLDLSLTGASGRGWVFAPTTVLFPGEILWCATGVTVSGGAVTIGANVIPRYMP